MRVSEKHAWVLVAAGIAAGTAQVAVAQDAPQAKFAAPVRIKAGDGFLGAGRYYPSPVLHDVDGDGRADIVVGDLVGKVTRALRAKDARSLALGAEEPLPDYKGEPLKFHNW
jgi:hypothetical protein